MGCCMPGSAAPSDVWVSSLEALPLPAQLSALRTLLRRTPEGRTGMASTPSPYVRRAHLVQQPGCVRVGQAGVGPRRSFTECHVAVVYLLGCKFRLKTQ